MYILLHVLLLTAKLMSAGLIFTQLSSIQRQTISLFHVAAPVYPYAYVCSDFEQKQQQKRSMRVVSDSMHQICLLF